MPAIQATLYDRLGGQTGISALVRDIWENHIHNPLIWKRYVNADLESIKRLVCRMFGASTGNSAGMVYPVMDRVAAISDEEYVAIINDFIKAMEKNGVRKKERDEVLCILYSLKREILYV